MLPRSISNGMFSSPSLTRTGIENFDAQSAGTDMNGEGGSPLNFPGNVLHDPQWDKYYDMLHDSAGGRTLKMGRASGPQGLGNDPNWWAQGIDPNTSNPQTIQNAIPPSLRGLYKAGQ